MNDETALGAMTPALPSRATGESKPLTPAPGAQLPKREIERLKRRRKRSLKRVNTVRRAVRTAVPTKSANRPLEMKNRLTAVLGIVGAMSKQEGSVFIRMMQNLEGESRTARKNILAALLRVYE